MRGPSTVIHVWQRSPGGPAGVVHPLVTAGVLLALGSETCLRVSPTRISLPLLTARSPRDTMPTSRFARLSIGRLRIIA